MPLSVILAISLQSHPKHEEVQAFVGVQQAVLAVKTTSGWHSPTDSTRFSRLAYPAISARIGELGTASGTLKVHHDRKWGWQTEATSSLLSDEVACCRVHPKFPRKIVTSDDPKGFFRTTATELFKSKKFAVERIDQIQVCRGDLRGDGLEEVLVAVQATGQVNPATLVFLRQVTGKRISTRILEFHIMGFPKISAIGDFVGDGSMQAVISGGISDGAMGSLWSFKSVEPKKLASFIWGD